MGPGYSNCVDYNTWTYVGIGDTICDSCITTYCDIENTNIGTYCGTSTQACQSETTVSGFCTCINSIQPVSCQTSVADAYLCYENNCYFSCN